MRFVLFLQTVLKNNYKIKLKKIDIKPDNQQGDQVEINRCI